MNITTVGIDLAKSVFQVHGVWMSAVRWVYVSSSNARRSWAFLRTYRGV